MKIIHENFRHAVTCETHNDDELAISSRKIDCSTKLDPRHTRRVFFFAESDLHNDFSIGLLSRDPSRIETSSLQVFIENERFNECARVKNIAKSVLKKFSQCRFFVDELSRIYRKLCSLAMVSFSPFIYLLLCALFNLSLISLRPPETGFSRYTKHAIEPT